MTRHVLLMTFALLFTNAVATNLRADGLLFGFEGDTLPGSGADWVIANACELDCSRRLENGHFLLEWGVMDDSVNYDHTIASSSGPPPPPATLWVEWRFRSNQPRPATSASCDAQIAIDYIGILDVVFAFQDAVFDNASNHFVLGLDPDIFHTYRFESLDGENFTVSVDGFVFKVGFDSGTNPVAFIQFGGLGSCGGFRPQPVRNEWDYIRYGTIGEGERIVSTDPPAGEITVAQAAGLTSILVTFDQPNYVYIDNIAVSVTSGIAPHVIATRRLDNGNPNVLELVLDRPMPAGAVTTFILTDASGVQTIIYGVGVPIIPASSTWGLIVFALGAAIAGSLIFRKRTARFS